MSIIQAEDENPSVWLGLGSALDRLGGLCFVTAQTDNQATGSSTEVRGLEACRAKFPTRHLCSKEDVH